jgi:putative flippase GtrA
MPNTTRTGISTRSQPSRALIRKFGQFAVVGVAATAVQYVLLIVLVSLKVRPVIASDIGFVASAILNYLLNYHLTFRSTKAHVESGPKFVMVATLGLLLNSIIMHVGTELIGLHHLVTQIFATGAVAIWNFTGHHLWSFGVGGVNPTRAREESR